MDYLSIVNKIKSKFTEEELKDYELIVSFKLNNVGDAFGIFTQKRQYVSYKFVKALINAEILDVAKIDNYENLVLNVDSLTDETINKFIDEYKKKSK